MKVNILQLALISSWVVFVGPAVPLRAEDAANTKQPGIYNEAARGAKQVADAVIIATRENKRILLQFGANWCSWCVKLHKLFETDKAVKEELRANYVVALIDVNNGHNQDLVVKYGAETGYGLPFLVVLDGHGKHLITKHSDDFEEGDHHDPQKVLAFLRAPLMTNAAALRGPIEKSNAVRDDAGSRQIAHALLEMQRQWATNNFRAKGMTVPKVLADLGEVSGSSAGILGAYVQYAFQRDGIEWTRSVHVLRSNTNTTTWVLHEFAAPKDTNLSHLARKRELITVTAKP